jgi:hypothetical protein
MKYFTEIIFWMVVLYWPFYRDSVEGTLQNFTDVTMLLAVVLTLFGYWKRWQNAKTTTTNKNTRTSRKKR